MARVQEFEFEMERGNQSVTYVAEFSVTPEEPDHYDRTVGGPGGWSPGSPAEVEDVRVYLVRKVKKDGRYVTQRERRPELDDVVSESELLEYAGEQSEGEREDYEADEYDRRMDR